MNEHVVLVLASGRGERFKASGGGEGSKLQALLGGIPVLRWTLRAVEESGLPFHVEDRGHAGMGDSIAAAVRATAQATGWLVLPADLPFISPLALRNVAAALGESRVVVPRFRGQAGHPVGFAAACRDALSALAGPTGAAAIVQATPAHRIATLDLDDPGIVMDIDTVQDLDRAEQLLQSGWRPAAPPR